MSNTASSNQASYLQAVSRISELIDAVRERLNVVDRDSPTIALEAIEHSVVELASTQCELQRRHRSVRESLAREGVLWPSNDFDEIGASLATPSIKCLELARLLRLELSRLSPHPFFAPRKWWRVRRVSRRIEEITRDLQQLLDVAQKWPASDPARVSAARTSIAAGNAVELKDVLRELHAAN